MLSKMYDRYSIIEYYFISLPLISLVLAAASVLTFRMLRWWRSKTLSWPKGLSNREQSLICKLYFERYGIKVEEVPIVGDTYDVELRYHRAHVFIKLRNTDFGVSESFIKDVHGMSKARGRGPSTFVILLLGHAPKVSIPGLAAAVGVAVLHQSQLSLIRDAMTSSHGAELRSNLLMKSL